MNASAQYLYDDEDQPEDYDCLNEDQEEYWMRKRCPACWDMSVCDPYDPEATCLNCGNLLFAYLSEEA